MGMHHQPNTLTWSYQGNSIKA